MTLICRCLTWLSKLFELNLPNYTYIVDEKDVEINPDLKERTTILTDGSVLTKEVPNLSANQKQNRQRRTLQSSWAWQLISLLLSYLRNQFVNPESISPYLSLSTLICDIDLFCQNRIINISLDVSDYKPLDRFPSNWLQLLFKSLLTLKLSVHYVDFPSCFYLANNLRSINADFGLDTYIILLPIKSVIIRIELVAFTPVRSKKKLNVFQLILMEYHWGLCEFLFSVMICQHIC